jgi:hypothetical protein
MKGIIKKLRKIEEMRDDLDSHIWSIFSRYIKQEGILFNGPDDWQIDGDSIYFDGSDGCMGCYDSMNLNIPIKYFEDPDIAFAERTEEIEKAEEEKKENRRLQEEQQERKEFKRLQEKFGGDHE